MSDASDDDLNPSPSRQRTEDAQAAVRNITDLSDDDSEGPQHAAIQRSDEARAAVRTIAALSDDESGEERPRTSRREPSSSPHADSPSRHSDDPHPNRLANGAGDEETQDQDASEDDREVSPPPEKCYERVAGTHGALSHNADMMYFPPNISCSMAITDKLDKLPKEQNPILYRLKPQVRGSKSVISTALDVIRKNPDPVSWADYFESNANLITWSDGSKTIAIGSQQFLLIEDALASKHFLFRRGDKIQTCESAINKVVRVQPSSTGDADVKLAMANAMKKAAGVRRTNRTMMRCMNDDGEQEEEKAKQESQRRERERARLEAKRRRARERHVRPNRRLTVEALESNDEDSGEDHVRRLEERVGASRLMRAKREAAPSRPAISVKRRKVGRRKLVGSDDDDDLNSDDSD